MSDPLKRDSRSMEPEPEVGLRFVVHKHRARTLHYDLRLEAGGVMKSWAIPKGPSMRAGERRLAIPTEDHELAYAEFEGVIAEGEYGAGAVILWDRGKYRHLTEHRGERVGVQEAIARGHLSVWLAGEKLRGGFSLTRFRTGAKELWFLAKSRDEFAEPDDSILTRAEGSVLTGRTIEEVEQDTGHRMENDGH